MKEKWLLEWFAREKYTIWYIERDNEVWYNDYGIIVWHEVTGIRFTYPRGLVSDEYLINTVIPKELALQEE